MNGLLRVRCYCYHYQDIGARAPEYSRLINDNSDSSPSSSPSSSSSLSSSFLHYYLQLNP